MIFFLKYFLTDCFSSANKHKNQSFFPKYYSIPCPKQEKSYLCIKMSRIFSTSISRNIDLFESLFNTYYAGLVVYGTRLVGDANAAEDIVCDLFTLVWEKQDILQMENLKAYLFTAVRNRALNYLAQLKVRDEYQENIVQKGDVTGLLTWEYYVESELREHIKRAIHNLPPSCQKIFVMSRFENKSIAKIAEEMQLSPRTVEKQIEIALKKLRVDLADYLSVAYLVYLLYP